MKKAKVQNSLLADARAGQGDPSVEFPDGTDHLEDSLPKDPLAVKPKAAPSATAIANAIHSTHKGGKGFRVIVIGEYFSRPADSRESKRKNYKIPFVLPEISTDPSKPGPLGIIVAKLLMPALKAMDPDTIRYRTHEILSVEPLDPQSKIPMDLRYMERAQLERFIEDQDAPINSEDYVHTQHLREACVDWKLNADGFEEREAKRQAERASDAELAALNDIPATDLGGV